MDGVINVLKPPGMTSHDVVYFVRKFIPGIKVGHAGTLDPAAAGVLPLCIGKGTKLAQYLLAGKKGYRGEIKLGVTTDTGDGEGRVLVRRPAAPPPEELVKKVFYSLTGEIEQVPPVYSAVRYRGRRLYEMARKGEPIPPLKPRKVTVFRFDLLAIIESSFPGILFEVECSHGTYIRALATRVGETIGPGAHLSFLVRTFAGPFSLNDAVTLERLQETAERGNWEDVILPLDFALQDLASIKVGKTEISHLVNGRFLTGELLDKLNISSWEDGRLFKVYDLKGAFRALAQWDKTRKRIKAEKVFFQEGE